MKCERWQENENRKQVTKGFVCQIMKIHRIFGEHLSSIFFFLSIFEMQWCQAVGRRRTRETMSIPWLVPQWLQQADEEQTEDSREAHTGLMPDDWGPSTYAVIFCLFCTLEASWIGSRAAWTQSGTLMGNDRVTSGGLTFWTMTPAPATGIAWSNLNLRMIFQKAQQIIYLRSEWKKGNW